MILEFIAAIVLGFALGNIFQIKLREHLKEAED
jgi:hypothetical protein